MCANWVGKRRQVPASVQNGRVAGQRKATTDGTHERTSCNRRPSRLWISRRSAGAAQDCTGVRQSPAAAVRHRRLAATRCTTWTKQRWRNHILKDGGPPVFPPLSTPTFLSSPVFSLLFCPLFSPSLFSFASSLQNIWRRVQTDGNYIVSQKNTCHFYFLNNFVKPLPILIIFSLQYDKESWRKWLCFGHLALILPLHYLVKCSSCCGTFL